MLFLLRLLIIFFALWFVCRFFYKLGRKSNLNEHKKSRYRHHNRKKVDSKVVENKEEQ